MFFSSQGYNIKFVSILSFITVETMVYFFILLESVLQISSKLWRFLTVLFSYLLRGYFISLCYCNRTILYLSIHQIPSVLYTKLSNFGFVTVNDWQQTFHRCSYCCITRSSLQKIYERDDTASKRIVLCVAAIRQHTLEDSSVMDNSKSSKDNKVRILEFIFHSF